MELQIAQRSQAKIRLCLQGPAGAGKTYSALLVAYGLCGDWSKVAVIDTEHYSASLYSHLGEYKVLPLAEPYSPEHYQEAVQVCESAGMEVIILDTISLEWQFLLDYHASLSGNSFTNWSKVTPRHNHFVKALLHSPAHIIATARTKQDYVLSEKNGKLVPEKVGLKAIQRDDLDYEFTLVFDLDTKNQASASKDRTSLFQGKPPHLLTADTGQQIRNWCELGSPSETEPTIREQIALCTSLKELSALYHRYPEQQVYLKAEYQQQKLSILKSTLTQNHLTTSNLNRNGKQHHSH
ncbi:AAA family ATPase [Adhaeribacter radiodurans]|uniref:AAA family ATPase n=1 Tax=Adhaeribacter radiodurans TaxID=2745197 RepID=A0A7L7L7L1_9BACT|nr:AAA family ATPase [Adhaeribacter radiodurans]QMU28788.1 AAA family ATPase [Adhaeribacter radiodurans]